MAKFEYVSRNSSGRISRGEIEAVSAAQVAATLKSRGEKLIRCEYSQSNTLTWQQSLAYLHPYHWVTPRSTHVELVLEQLGLMLRSGLTLIESLKTASEQAVYRSLRLTCDQMSSDIQAGMSFGDAMQKQKCFPDLVVQLTRVGEQTGNLDELMMRSATYMNRRRTNRNNLLMALAYPLFVALAAIAVAAFMVINVIPKLSVFLRALGRELPQMTQRLVDISDWVQLHWAKIVVGIVATVVIITVTYISRQGRRWIDRNLLRVPIIGHVLRLSGTFSFASGMSILLRSGITLLEGLRTAEYLQKNVYLAECVHQARSNILHGSNLATPLARQHAFTPILSSMVAVGERTGQLDEVLEEVANFHESQLERTIKRLSALVEPATIIVVGGIVGYVYIAFFVALYSVGVSPR